MKRERMTPENTVFVVLSFEGPDTYSLAGGLAVRVDGVTKTLASMGFPVHLFFIGDPRLKGEESSADGRLRLHRWCQWISDYYPRGVYEGENEKLYDFNESIPWFVSEHIAKPAVGQGKIVAILGEEWHTAEAMCRTGDRLHTLGIRDNALMFWNANNIFGFDRVDWRRLARGATITTVSRYMKHSMWKQGVNPLVVPNGIPASLLNDVDESAAFRLRRPICADVLLAKIARYHPDKRWNMAVEAAAGLKARGDRSVLLARGGIEPHGGEIMHRARAVGLQIRDIDSRGASTEDHLAAVQQAGDADFLNLMFHCPQDFLRLIYRAADAVLANSGHEPFGLVGLEAMAAGGVAFTGSTGEDYAVHLKNSVVLETADPREIETYISYLRGHPEESQKIRKTARKTASDFTWERALRSLIQKLEYQARLQGLLGRLTPHRKAARTVDRPQYDGLSPLPGVEGRELELARQPA